MGGDVWSDFWGIKHVFMCFSSYKKMLVEAIMNHCSIINNSKETNFQTLKLKKKQKEKQKKPQ